MERPHNVALITGAGSGIGKAIAQTFAKHGMQILVNNVEESGQTVALEVAADGITANAICPAYVRTPLVENQIASQAQTHHLSEDNVIDQMMLGPAAIKHLVEPEEVADLALYLVSDRARSMTGAAHMIDLGWTPTSDRLRNRSLKQAG
jgi:3-hydroxybutyrate dehydrogenase